MSDRAALPKPGPRLVPTPARVEQRCEAEADEQAIAEAVFAVLSVVDGQQARARVMRLVVEMAKENVI